MQSAQNKFKSGWENHHNEVIFFCKDDTLTLKIAKKNKTVKLPREKIKEIRLEYTPKIMHRKYHARIHSPQNEYFDNQ